MVVIPILNAHSYAIDSEPIKVGPCVLTHACPDELVGSVYWRREDSSGVIISLAGVVYDEIIDYPLSGVDH